MVTITQQEFNLLAKYIHLNFGIFLKPEKKTLVVGRLSNLLMQKKIETFSEYYEHLLHDRTGKAAIELVNRVTTNHTYFLREVKHFQFFQETVLPYLLEKHKLTRELRIWSAGCSSGEEPYTLSMGLADYFYGKPEKWDTRILATDISHEVLRKAYKGIYSKEKIATIPPEWRKRYLTSFDEQYDIFQDSIRKNVIFKHLNLIEPFPFKKKFQVIFCRNVMIYFDEKTRKDLIQKFYDYTEEGGYLFIGMSETLAKENQPYEYIMPSVYRKGGGK